MTIHVDWYDKRKQIIMSYYYGDFTLEEIQTAETTIQQLSHKTSGRFDLISNFLDAAYTPPVGSLWAWKELVHTRHEAFPNWGLTVFVATSGVFEAYFKEGVESSEIIRQHARLATSLTEALKLILDDRHSQQTDTESSAG